MEQKVITDSSASGLNAKMKILIKEGWTPVGSHQVVTRNSQNRYSGMQHRDTQYESEYSQTMRKD
jgi:hypothetical protein